MREERCADFVSLEAEKITTIQTTIGSQYFANDFSFDTAHRKPSGSSLCNLKPTERNSARPLRTPQSNASVRGILLTLALNLSLLERVRLNSC